MIKYFYLNHSLNLKYYYSSQSGPGSNGTEVMFHIPQSFKTGASPSNLVSYPGHSLGAGILPLCRDAVGIFYHPSRLGCVFFLVI